MLKFMDKIGGSKLFLYSLIMGLLTYFTAISLLFLLFLAGF